MTAFFALLRRDLLVTFRSAFFLLSGSLTQPILVVLVFGNLLPRMGLVADQFRSILIPGLMAITMLMSGVQAVLMPLMTDLSGTREVDERLLAPIAPFWVAFGRVVAGAVHAGVAGLLALPLMMILVHEVAGLDIHPRFSWLVPLVVLSGFLAASFGLNLGTRVQPRFSGLLFAVVLGPMMLFGCAYYPWSMLSTIGPVQWAFLLNPLVFMSEAMRASVTPEVTHMPLFLILSGLIGFTALFTAAGARSFAKRTIL